MNKRLILIVSFLLLLAITACQPRNAETEAVTVVKAYYDALNEQQIDEAMGYIADDASFVNPTGTYQGKDEIQASLEGLAGAGITFELSAFKDEGGRVTYDYKVLQNGQLLDQGPGGLTIVEEGKIVFDGTEDTEPN